MTTVAFANEADFHTWHDMKCTQLEIPFPGYNQETGQPVVTDQWTTAAASPLVVDGQVCITVTDAYIADNPDLSKLPVVDVRYPAEPGSDVDAEGNPVSVIEEFPGEVHKPVPATWMDKDTGILWDTSTGEPYVEPPKPTI